MSFSNTNLSTNELKNNKVRNETNEALVSSSDGVLNN